MPKLEWNNVGERLYETGTKKGVLFTQTGGTYDAGVAWNGLISISESPSGAEPSKLYADDGVFLTMLSKEEFGCSIEAYMYPDEFAECDGSAALVTGVYIGQQTRKPFGLSYVTTIGSDTDGEDYGYKIHLIYGCLAAPSEKAYQTINESPEAMTMSWDVSTTPVEVTGHKPTASLVIDSTKVDAAKLAAFEAILYGSDGSPGTTSQLMLPGAVMTHFGVSGG